MERSGNDMFVPTMSPDVVPVVVLQHAEESAFLWSLRRVACDAPHYNLRELAGLDERIEAHLDGLRVAGDFGWEICEQALSEEEEGAFFTAGVLAFESGNRLQIHRLMGLVASQSAPAFGLVHALGWIPSAQARSVIGELVAAGNP